MSIARNLNARFLATVSVLALAAVFVGSEAAWADGSVLSASPASWDFGNDDIHGGGGPTQTFTFTNNTSGDVNVSTDAVVGSDTGSFGLNANTCPGAFLPPAASCTVDVTFSATSAGPKAASLELTDDSGTVDVPFSGTGVTGTLTASPDPPSFNPQPWFYGGQQQGVNLQNSNDAGTHVTSATITGPDAGRFYIAYGQNCSSQQLGPGSSCGMGIGFQPPNGPGSFHAQLEVTSDSLSSPLIVPLNATALSGPHITLSPDDVSFGDVAVGQQASRTITVANDGDSPLQVQQALIVTGTPQVFPVTADGCTGQSVDPGSTCQFTVHFQPKAAGTKERRSFSSPTSPHP